MWNTKNQAYAEKRDTHTTRLYYTYCSPLIFIVHCSKRKSCNIDICYGDGIHRVRFYLHSFVNATPVFRVRLVATIKLCQAKNGPALRTEIQLWGNKRRSFTTRGSHLRESPIRRRVESLCAFCGFDEIRTDSTATKICRHLTYRRKQRPRDAFYRSVQNVCAMRVMML